MRRARGRRRNAVLRDAGLGARPIQVTPASHTMITSDKEARTRARERDAQVGLPARRAAVELLSAVLQNKQPLDDILGRSLDKGAMFNLTARDRALTRAIVATSLRRKGQLDLVLGAFLERGLPERSGTLLSDPAVGRGAARLS